MLRRALPLLVLIAATLTACDDPSNVGLGLAGGEGGQPLVYRTPLSALPLTDQPELAGGTSLLLAGHTDDPLLGQIEATGYVDFAAPAAVGKGTVPGFRAGTVTGAYLELRRSYLYGDTLSSPTFSLSPITEEFSQISAPSDTSFQIGSPLLTFTYSLADSVVKVPLPAGWVADNDTTLRSVAFATSFHGFALRAAGGNTIVGFDPADVHLYATTAEDTVVFVAGKNVSATERLSEPDLPPGYVLLQDGFPNSYRVEMKLDTISVRTSDLNRLSLELAHDAVLFDQTPPGYVRPVLRQIELIGVDEKDQTLLSGGGNYFLRAISAPRADGRMVFSNLQMTTYGRTQLRGETSYPVKSLLLQAPPSLGTLSAVLLHAPGTAGAPTFALTIVSTD